MDVLEHFALKEAPFRTSPDPRFLYLSDQVSEAIAKCEYMARERVGPIYMFGPIGSGKTTILRRLYDLLAQDERYDAQLIISPNIKTANALLRLIMESFGVPTARAYDQSLKLFEMYLLEAHDQGSVPVLLVDEAQNITRDMLRLIHYLLNYETVKVKLLQIVLVGQDELATRVRRYSELSSRMFPISMNAMSPDELEHMLRFRWMVAGGKKIPFDDEVIKAIYGFSKGLPRDTIKLCDAYSDEIDQRFRCTSIRKLPERLDGHRLVGSVRHGQLGSGLSLGLSFELDAEGVVDEAIENGVGKGGVAAASVPFVDGDLGGDEAFSSQFPLWALRVKSGAGPSTETQFYTHSSAKHPSSTGDVKMFEISSTNHGTCAVTVSNDCPDP